MNYTKLSYFIHYPRPAITETLAWTFLCPGRSASIGVFIKASAAKVEAFIEKAKRYMEIRELTPKILRLFISRIEVGERGEKYSRTAEQNIRIIYRDVGMMDSVEPVEDNIEQKNIA